MWRNYTLCYYTQQEIKMSFKKCYNFGSNLNAYCMNFTVDIDMMRFLLPTNERLS